MQIFNIIQIAGKSFIYVFFLNHIEARRKIVDSPIIPYDKIFAPFIDGKFIYRLPLLFVSIPCETYSPKDIIPHAQIAGTLSPSLSK
jgi:hypothetical protein